MNGADVLCDVLLALFLLHVAQDRCAVFDAMRTSATMEPHSAIWLVERSWIATPVSASTAAKLTS
jgi:hypothetical protein